MQYKTINTVPWHAPHTRPSLKAFVSREPENIVPPPSYSHYHTALVPAIKTNAYLLNRWQTAAFGPEYTVTMNDDRSLLFSGPHSTEVIQPIEVEIGEGDTVQQITVWPLDAGWLDIDRLGRI